MNFKKLLRGPFLYIIAGAIVLWIGFTLLAGLGGFRPISTQEGLELLESGPVETPACAAGLQPPGASVGARSSGLDAPPSALSLARSPQDASPPLPPR